MEYPIVHPASVGRGVSLARLNTREVGLLFSFGDGMPDLKPAELKRRRRAAARTLLSGPRGTPVATKKHLVDGVRVDRLPFDAGDA